MPNLNLADARGRDAVVSGESVTVRNETLWVDEAGEIVSSFRMLQATSDHSMEALLAANDDNLEKLGAALIEGDPEVDIERFGSFLSDLSRVFVSPDGSVVHHIEQFEVVRGPDGSLKDRKPRERTESNTDSEFPLAWTGKKMPKKDAIRRFVFSGKLQVAHVNGLTYDFLFDMAKDLHEADSLLLVGAGPKGKDPLVFRRGSLKYRGFLEGRVDGEKYALILHLSNQELKAPAPIEKADKDDS